MKRALIMILAMCLLLLCGCGANPSTTEQETDPVVLDYTAKEADVTTLEKLYEGRVAYHGDIHCHTDSGGNSDGQYPIGMWPSLMQEINSDFSAIVDHQQTLQMMLDEWDETVFISGSECGQMVWGMDGRTKEKMHGNYLFPDLESMENMLNEFPELFSYDPETGRFYGYGGVSDSVYLPVSRNQMAEVIESVKRNGGLFVFDHPKDEGYCPTSEDIWDYWYANETGIEVFYGQYGRAEDSQLTKLHYELWKDLLAEGMRVWATAGSDSHQRPNTNALTTIYSTEQTGSKFVEYLRVGDFTPAPMGIRMAVGDTLMGGKGSFEGQKVIFSVGDFHEVALENGDQFRAVLLDDTGEVFSQVFTAGETVFFSTEAQADKRFYRVEIYNVTTGDMVGLGNPIWNQ